MDQRVEQSLVVLLAVAVEVSTWKMAAVDLEKEEVDWEKVG